MIVHRIRPSTDTFVSAVSQGARRNVAEVAFPPGVTRTAWPILSGLTRTMLTANQRAHYDNGRRRR